MNTDNARGVRYMVLAMTLFIVNDSLVKFVSQLQPCGVLIFVRGLFATALALLALRWTGTPLVALLLGWAVWGEVPNTLAWLGSAAVVASGLVLLRRQRLVAHAAAAPPSD